ncbi:MAG: C1q-like domain-containing protein [Gammaproteobacteria bacterium]
MKSGLYNAVVLLPLLFLTACCCLDKSAIFATHTHDESFTGSVSTPTYEIVKFNHVEFDVQNEYNKDTGKFTARENGYYLVLVGINFFGLGTNNGMFIQVFVNNTASGHYSYSNLLLNNHQNPNQRLSTVVKLKKNDVLDIRVSPLNRIDLYSVSHSSQLSIIKQQ